MIATDPTVAAIIVAYHPRLDRLDALVSSLSRQVAHVIVVDNSDPDDTTVRHWARQESQRLITMLHMCSNVGIAAALNAGIRRAQSFHATHVLLSDQDSVPAPSMVLGLMSVFEGTREDVRIAAVGPTFVDRNTGLRLPFQFKPAGAIFYRHAQPSESSPVIETVGLITSGCLVSMLALGDIGGMREDLFIDYVDAEWCQRALAKGWHLYATSRAEMTHDMGDGCRRVWFFGWRNESAYSPIRMYYRTRNFIMLCRLHHIPAPWKIRGTWYLLGSIYTQVFYGQERGQTWRMVVRGLWDGLRGRMGRYGSNGVGAV